MKLSLEIRADILKTLMAEDRNEIRDIRSSIYNVTKLLGTASFAITAFLLGQDVSRIALICVISDGFIAVLLWIFFLRLKVDLYSGRQCLVARQKLIRDLGTVTESDNFDPFPDARNQTPDVTDSELWWLPTLTSAVLAVKALIVWLQFA